MVAKVKSMRGKELDLHAFMASHAEKPAIRPSGGLTKLNTRGDKLGSGGYVVKTAEQMRHEYNRSNPKAVSKQVSLKNIQQEVFASSVSPAEAVKQALQQQKAVPPAVAESPKKRKLVDDPDAGKM